MSKNPGNVAGGLKATLNNPRVSDEAKNDAKERLDAMKSGAPVDEVQTQTSATDADKNPGNQIGGYKATLSSTLLDHYCGARFSSLVHGRPQCVEGGEAAREGDAR